MTFFEKFRDANFGSDKNYANLFVKFGEMLFKNRSALVTAGVLYRGDQTKDIRALNGNFLRLVLLLTSIVPENFDARVSSPDITNHINEYLKKTYDSTI